MAIIPRPTNIPIMAARGCDPAEAGEKIPSPATVEIKVDISSIANLRP